MNLKSVVLISVVGILLGQNPPKRPLWTVIPPPIDYQGQSIPARKIAVEKLVDGDNECYLAHTEMSVSISCVPNKDRAQEANQQVPEVACFDRHGNETGRLGAGIYGPAGDGSIISVALTLHHTVQILINHPVSGYCQIWTGTRHELMSVCRNDNGNGNLECPVRDSQ